MGAALCGHFGTKDSMNKPTLWLADCNKEKPDLEILGNLITLINDNSNNHDHIKRFPGYFGICVCIKTATAFN